MSIEHDKEVMERYINALMRELPDGWHCITLLMMANSDDHSIHSIASYCDTPPTHVPALLRLIAQTIEEQTPPPQPLVEPH